MGKKIIYLPDFIIIGANKAGTTSVASYLNQHPDILMSRVKEPMFFSSLPNMQNTSLKNASLKNPYFAITLEEYSNMFYPDNKEAKLFGEASTSYLANPYTSVLFMRKIIPEVKIIVILREPVSRMVSAYNMCVRDGIEDRHFKQIVEEAKNQLLIKKEGHGVKEYFRNGLYFQLLSPYIKSFDKKQILVLNYDDLMKSPQNFMINISNFIGVDYFPFDLSKKLNTAKKLKNDKYKIENKDILILKSLYKNELLNLKTIINVDFTSCI